MRRKKNAFTLVELLVVISIIALLMSILVPSLSKAREQARKVVCLSNLKQFGSVFNLYTNDYHGKFSPGPHAINGTGKFQYAWQWILSKYYANSDKIVLCPSAKKPRYEDKNGRWSSNSGDAQKMAWTDGNYNQFLRDTLGVDTKSFYSSYGVNSWIQSNLDGMGLGQFEIHRQSCWSSVGSSKTPYNVPVFADSTNMCAYPLDTDTVSNVPLTSRFANWGEPHMRYFCIDRHNMSINVLFMDWSVRNSSGLKSLWTYKWNRDFDITAKPAWKWVSK